MIIAFYVAAALSSWLSVVSISPGKKGLSQISGRRILRIIGHFVLSLSRRCFGAFVGDRFCRNTADQRWPLHRPLHPLLALFLFWLRQEAKGLKRTSMFRVALHPQFPVWVKLDPCGRGYAPVNFRSSPKPDIAFRTLASDASCRYTRKSYVQKRKLARPSSSTVSVNPRPARASNA